MRGLRWQEASVAELETTDVGGAVGDAWGRAHLWPLGARWRGGASLFAIFCAYVGVALLYPFTETGGVSLLWMPNAVLVTALLKFRPRDWPYVYAAGLLAEVVVDQWFNVAPQHALTFGIVNVIEASLFVVCAALIAGGRRNIGLLSARGAVAVIVASVMVPALTATLGAVGSVWAFDSDYFTGWRTWWFGDAMGLLVGVPVGLLLRDAARSVARRRSGRLTIGTLAAATPLIALSTYLALHDQFWGTQQTALAAGVLLSLAFGAVGAPTAAVLIATVTLIALAKEGDFAAAPQQQALLVVGFAALYAIASITESIDRQHKDLIEAQLELQRVARFDSLTGLFNRGAALARLQNELSCARDPGPELGVLYCDVDRFKDINDTWGHAAGDLVLSTVAARVRECVREGDTVGRTGGDEMLVLLPGLHSLDEAAQIAEKIRARTAAAIQHSGSNLHATLSIGVTLAIPGASASELTARADAAMYQAKNAGGNIVSVSGPNSR